MENKLDLDVEKWKKLVKDAEQQKRQLDLLETKINKQKDQLKQIKDSNPPTTRHKPSKSSKM